jgi:hypothetical protein
MGDGMSFPVDFPVSQDPLNEADIPEPGETPECNYAQTTGKRYRLTDGELNKILAIVMGSGSAAGKNWVQAQRVTIRGETVQWLQRRGDKSQLVPPIRF